MRGGDLRGGAGLRDKTGCRRSQRTVSKGTKGAVGGVISGRVPGDGRARFAAVFVALFEGGNRRSGKVLNHLTFISASWISRICSSMRL